MEGGQGAAVANDYEAKSVVAMREASALGAPKPLRDNSSGGGGPPLVTTNNFLVSTSIIVGLFGVILMNAPIEMRAHEFYNFANYALQILDQTPFVVYSALGTLVVGFLGIVTGCCMGTAGLLSKNYPALVYVSLFVLLAHAVATLAAGGLIMNGISVIDNAIYRSNGTSSVRGSFTSNAVHFQLAMFNGCCAPRGWTKESFLPGPRDSLDALDTDGYVKFCGHLHRDNLADLRQAERRACYDSQETYREMNYTVSNNLPRICATLADARVNIEGKKVPNSQFAVSTLTLGKMVIPIVDNNNAPAYGCGTGYAKAFQAAMLIWVENFLKPIMTTFLVLGALELVLLFIIITSNYACNVKTESAEEAYARYMDELKGQPMTAMAVPANWEGGGGIGGAADMQQPPLFPPQQQQQQPPLFPPQQQQQQPPLFPPQQAAYQNAPNIDDKI